MTTFFKWLNNPYVLGGLLLVGVTVDLVLAGQAYDLSKSDWGTWVGSVGTVLTLVGTIWIATSADRKRRGEQLDLAIISAASLAHWISSLYTALWTAQQELPNGITTQTDIRSAFAKGIDAIERVGIWTPNDLLPLVPLPDHLAARLAEIAMRMRGTFSTIRHESKNRQGPVVETIGVQQMFSSALDNYGRELMGIRREVAEFLRHHGVGDD